MKIRKGFVSNSSSSSFVCDMCKEEYSGWDLYPSFHCINGHQACENCKPEWHILSKEELIKIASDYYKELISDFKDPNQYNYYSKEGKDKQVIYLTNKLESVDETSCEEIDWDEKPAEICPICRLEIYDDNEICLYLYKKFGISRDDVFAKVKALNKRRKKLYDSEYIEYVCKENNTSTELVMREIRDTFKTWENYNNYLSGESK